MWSAVSGFKLSYAVPPASFETQGQKSAHPRHSGRQAWPLAWIRHSLFAAALEQAGLNALS